MIDEFNLYEIPYPYNDKKVLAALLSTYGPSYIIRCKQDDAHEVSMSLEELLNGKN